jgi:cation transporter-like permease
MKTGFAVFISMLISLSFIIGSLYVYANRGKIYRESTKIMLFLCIWSIILGFILLGLYFGNQIC